MPSKSSRAPTLDLKNTSFNKGMQNPASKSADALKPESALSPVSPRSPKSTPSSPRSIKVETTIRPVTARSRTESYTTAPFSSYGEPEPPTPSLTAMPQYPPSPREVNKHNRDPSRSFFANLKASKSSHKISNSDSSGLSAEQPSKSRGSSRDRSHPPLRKTGSTSDLLDAATRAGKEKADIDAPNGQGIEDSKNIGDQVLSGPTLKKNKPRFANLLARTRSIRVDDSSAPRSAGMRRPSNATLLRVTESKEEVLAPIKTAPVKAERGFGEITSPTIASYPPDRSAENRPQTSRRDRGNPTMVSSSSFIQVSGASASLFNNIKHTSSGAADRLGKAGKGLFGKIARSGSTNEREVVLDDNYVCTVINLPLIEQTRKTRISKRLEDCKDKTEYWMPALPYRCIDYLNYKGCEEEGLYRVPGSGREVKHWQRRFDCEGDINLFDEPDLYDINTIGSMFKAWLRELPDELLPKKTQQMIAEKCEGATSAPQLLKDELSKLPPYNYYLLFAITCHLNLLHSYVDQNKMNYQNLCICFQPCMKIDGFCFQFLVCDWKNCWQGCWTEKEWNQKEQEALEKATKEAEEQKKNETNISNGHGVGQFYDSSAVADDRTISSSGSSQSDRPQTTRTNNQAASSRKTRPANIDVTSHRRSISQLPELGPPLSPIKI